MSADHQARYAAAGFDVDYSEAEQCEGSAIAPLILPLPLNGHMLPSVLADGFIITLTDNKTLAIIALGDTGRGVALHVGLTATELRQSAAGLLRAADYLDQGRGKQ